MVSATTRVRLSSAGEQFKHFLNLGEYRFTHVTITTTTAVICPPTYLWSIPSQTDNDEQSTVCGFFLENSLVDALKDK